MSDYKVFGYGNQLNRNETDPSTIEKREDCTTVPGFPGEVINLHKGTNPSTALRYGSFSEKTSEKSTCAVMRRIITFANQIFL